MFLTDVRRVASGLLILFIFATVNPNVARAAVSDIDIYNQAIEQVSSGEGAKAKEAFEQLANTASGETQRRAHYNLANLLAADGNFDEAVKHYEATLAMDSQDQQARDNLEWARRKSESKKKDQKSDQNNKDQDKDKKPGENSDQKNSDDKEKKSDDQKQDHKKDDNKDQKDADKNPEEKDKDKKQGKDKDQQKSQAEKSKDQQKPMTPEEAEKLLRAAPDDPKTMILIYRGDKLPPKSVKEDW